ncbi:MAG: T9SS type A sorting domain-containing protein [Candidatus Kapabacteria bacterium]|nr:T9SS type A sorting domain-containing protein [Candidatus Kapabacteria bacterium]
MKSATIVFMVSLVLCTSFMSAKNFHALAAHTPHSSVASNYTFSEHIAPIIWKHCVSCHRDGEIAPFSLTNYEEVAENALTIAAVTKSRFMPPWKPTQYARYADERGLTDDEIQILADWAAAGAPQGDPSKTPPLPVFPKGSQLGIPDVVLSMPEEFTVKADFKDEYRNFVIPFSFSSDKNISAVEFRPGNPAVVHHVLMWIDTTGKARKMDAADPLPGYSGFGGAGFDDAIVLPAAWVPGAVPRFFPDKMGIRIPKNADLVMQIHYAPSGSVQKDQSTVNIFYSDDKSIRQIREATINPQNLAGGNSSFLVKAETINRFKGVLDVPYDFSLMSIAPHMHLIGTKAKSYAITPKGDTIKLIAIDDWDFNWQGSYTFKKLIKIPKGAKVYYEAEYDNTANNPLNPNNPPRVVRWGENTTDEMFLCYFFGILYLPGDENISLETSNPTSLIDESFSIHSPAAIIIPNPMQHHGILSWTAPKDGNYSISITDITGAVVQTIARNTFFTAGHHFVELQNDYFASGMYFVHIYDGSSTQTVIYSVTP